MLASQYIYTSWKNGESRDKGFMVYALSDDVSQEESNEIRLTMKYNTASNMPFSPTDEEIKTLFPVAFSYFALSSGRYCMAQTTYVGKDYATDIDPRYGNFIIHAYIFDYNEKFKPDGFRNTEYFKKLLTLEERNAPEGPHSLPRIELPLEYKAVNNGVPEVLTGNEKEASLVVNLAQAIMNDPSLDCTMCVSCNEGDEIKWMEGLRYLLPEEIAGRLTYSTYTLYKDSTVKINFFYKESDYNPISEMAYSQIKCFYLNSDELQSRVTLSKFMQEMKRLALKGDNKALSFKNSILSLKKKYNIDDIDSAITLDLFLGKNYNSFKELTQLQSIYNIACETCKDKKKSEIASLTHDYIKVNLDSYGKANVFPLLREIYDSFEIKEQNEVKAQILIESYNKTNSPLELMERLEEANIYGNVLETILSIDTYNLLSSISKAKSEPYYYALCWKNYKKLSDKKLKAYFEGVLVNKTVDLFNTNQISKAKDNITFIKESSDIAQDLINVIVPKLNSSLWRDLDLAIYVMGLVKGNKSLFISIFEQAYLASQRGFGVIVKLREILYSTSFGKGLFENRSLPVSCNDMYDKFAIGSFVDNSSIDAKGLVSFYKDYVDTASNEERQQLIPIFDKKLRSYIDSLKTEKAISDSAYIYESIDGSRMVSTIAKSTFDILYTTIICNGSLQDLVKYNISLTTIESLNARAQEISTVDQSTLFYKDYLWFKENKDRITYNKDNFHYLKPFSSGTLNKEFMPLAFNGIMRLVRESEDKENSFVELTNVFSDYDEFYELLYAYLLKDVDKKVKLICAIFEYMLGNNTIFSRELLEKTLRPFLKKLKKGERDALFNEILCRTRYDSKAESFISEFNENNKSFFQTLKEILFPKKKEMDEEDLEEDEDRKKKNKKDKKDKKKNKNKNEEEETESTDNGEGEEKECQGKIDGEKNNGEPKDKKKGSDPLGNSFFTSFETRERTERLKQEEFKPKDEK